MNHYAGYIMLAAYGAVLLLIWRTVEKRYPERAGSVNEYIFAGRNASVRQVASSVFTAWVWVTTLIGSAEACVLYGVAGAVGYTVGASVAFVVFIALILAMLKRMPESQDFLTFTGERFSGRVKGVYYIFAMFTVVYVAVEQAAGIGFVINGFYQTSYQKVVFLVVLLAAFFVMFTGMRGILVNNSIGAAAIIAGFSVVTAMLAFKLDYSQVASGVLDVAANPQNSNYNPDMLSIASAAGIRYFILAIIVALGQILFDPGYYHKAFMARSRKAAGRAFFIGGLLMWCPVGLLSAFLFGFLSLSQGIDFSHSLNISVDIPTRLLGLYLPPWTLFLFALLVLVVGMTTIIHYLAGILGIFTVDFYTWEIKKGASDREKIRFGQVVTGLVGVCCALIATALENISILTIDTFSGVFFAAPCGALFASVLSSKNLKDLPLYSILIGLGAGFYVWVFAGGGRELGAFYGTVTSFFAPVLFLAIASLFVKKRFNYAKLRHWRQAEESPQSQPLHR